MKKIALLLLLAALLAAGVLAGRTATYRSRQLPPEPATPVAVDPRAAADRLAGAVRFRTISHQIPWEFRGSAFTDLHDYLAAAYPRAHETLRREVVAQYSLLYTWPGADPALPPIVCLAHLDVVPVDAATALAWEQPPFDGVVTETHVWGRGTLDNKSGVTGLLEAAEALIAEGWAPRRTIHFAFGHDEELGGPHGAGSIARLLEERGVRAWFTLDEGSGIVDGILPGVDTPVALISVAEKGYATIALTARAPGGHSSNPPAHTTLGRVARAIARLEENQMPARLEGPLLTMLDHVGPEMTLPLRAVMANLWLFRPLLRAQLLRDPTTAAALRTTTAPTIMNAGTKENVLPMEAKAMVNFRILPGDTPEDVLAHVVRVVNDPEVEIAIADEHEAIRPSAVSDHTGEAFARIARSIRQIHPRVPVAPGMTIAGTDSKHYYRVAENNYRFQPLIFTKDDLATIHGINERVRIENYVDKIRVYAQILRNTCG